MDPIIKVIIGNVGDRVANAAADAAVDRGIDICLDVCKQCFQHYYVPAGKPEPTQQQSHSISSAQVIRHTNRTGDNTVRNSFKQVSSEYSSEQSKVLAAPSSSGTNPSLASSSNASSLHKASLSQYKGSNYNKPLTLTTRPISPSFPQKIPQSPESVGTRFAVHRFRVNSPRHAPISHSSSHMNRSTTETKRTPGNLHRKKH